MHTLNYIQKNILKQYPLTNNLTELEKIIQLCKDSNCIIIYGESDDIVYINGKLNLQLDTWLGCDFSINDYRIKHLNNEEQNIIKNILKLKVLWYGQIKELNDLESAVELDIPYEIFYENKDKLNIPFSFEIDNTLTYQVFNIYEDSHIQCEALIIKL